MKTYKRVGAVLLGGWLGWISIRGVFELFADAPLLETTGCRLVEIPKDAPTPNPSEFSWITKPGYALEVTTSEGRHNFPFYWDIDTIYYGWLNDLGEPRYRAARLEEVELPTRDFEIGGGPDSPSYVRWLPASGFWPDRFQVVFDDKVGYFERTFSARDCVAAEKRSPPRS